MYEITIDPNSAVGPISAYIYLTDSEYVYEDPNEYIYEVKCGPNSVSVTFDFVAHD